MRLLLALIVALLSSCTNLYRTDITNNLPSSINGDVYVYRSFPKEDGSKELEKQKAVIYNALSRAGLTRVTEKPGELKPYGARWVLFYGYNLSNVMDNGFRVNYAGSTATISPDRLYSLNLKMMMHDDPQSPPRWTVDGRSATRHLSRGTSLFLIKDAMKDFPKRSGESDVWR